jgi:hypothetical protein
MAGLAIPDQESQTVQSKTCRDSDPSQFGQDLFKKEDIPQVDQGSQEIKKGR